MKKIVVIILLSLCSTFTGITQKIKEENKKPNYTPYYFHRVDHFERLPDTDDEIFFLGNSISDGCEWSELFGNLQFKNRGISGDVTDGILYRLRQITKCKPKQVFLMIGINDLARGRSVDYIVNNHLEIYDQIERESPSTQIIVQSLLPVNNVYGLFNSHTDKGQFVLEINKRLEKVCKQKGYVFIDLFSKMANKEGKLRKDLSVDGLHLNGLGYQIWKQEIAPWINKN